ncbi:MAG TPA: alkaline phosphatase PafA [Sphingobacteriaceae bacterium]
MRLKIVLFSLFAASTLIGYAQKNKSTSSIPRPKLVVGLMVDQMRWDYLYRFYDRYDDGGFKRMLKEGFSCENTYINYVPSLTGVGHSSVYTGSVPAIHGITGNDFTIQATGEKMYCAGDSTVEAVGSSSSAGKRSPRNLLTSTMTDELRLATNFRSKVISVASKDRASIMPGGHAANAAYWFDGSSGNWITSTYYMKSLPTWVNKFNAQKLAEKYLLQDWNTLYPLDTYLQSTKDNSPYETKYAGTATPTFPVKTSGMISKGYSILTNTPYGSTLTMEMAKAAVENEELGLDAITDFLTVSVSTPDAIGHQFGPNSIETEDTYLRLDRDISAFLSYLDKKVGKGNYSVFLTSDHAVAHNANFLKDNKIPAGLFPTSSILKNLNIFLEKELKVKDLIDNLMNYQVNLNYRVIREKKVNESELKQLIIDFLKKQDGVAFVVDNENAQTATIPNEFRGRILNGYNRERSGVIQIILEPGWYSGSSKTGASHGTLSPYDTHIPLVFMGWGIKQGKSNITYHITDIAPTISGLLHIQEPNGNIGKPINEVLK